MPPELNTVRLSYLPLVAVAPATSPIVSLQGRYGIPRRGEWSFPELSMEFALVFALPGSWTTIDPALSTSGRKWRIDVSGEFAGIVLQRSGCGVQRGAGDDSGECESGVRADCEERADYSGAEREGGAALTGCGWIISGTRWWMRLCGVCWNRMWRGRERRGAVWDAGGTQGPSILELIRARFAQDD